MYQTLQSAALALKKGGYFNLSTLTEPKMLKTNNPYYGRVLKFAVYSGVRSGVSYQNCVQNAQERNGHDADYIAESTHGMEWVEYPFILKSLKDPAQKYLRVSQDKSTKVSSCYLLDGRLATDAEVAEIKRFLPVSKPCEKQERAGLVDAEQIRPLSIKVQNVVSIKQGGIEYQNAELVAALQAANIVTAE